MRFHRLWANHYLKSDFTVRCPSRERAKHLLFATGQFRKDLNIFKSSNQTHLFWIVITTIGNGDQRLHQITMNPLPQGTNKDNSLYKSIHRLPNNGLRFTTKEQQRLGLRTHLFDMTRQTQAIPLLQGLRYKQKIRLKACAKLAGLFLRRD